MFSFWIELVGKESERKGCGTSVQFEFQKDDKANRAQLNDRCKKALTCIGSKQVDPEIGIDFRIDCIDKYIDQKERWHEHINGGVQLKEGIGERTELFKNRKANDQWEECLHYPQKEKTLCQE